jgi:hypothetical protein
VTRKAITTSHAVVSCDVCGRTLLRGEHADVFLHGGQRRMVCELCTPRAAHEGWIREGLDDVVASGSTGRNRRRGGSFLSRLRARRPEADLHPDDLEQPPPARAEPAYEPAPAPAPPAPEHELYESRSVRGIPTNAELKVARALELFNAGPNTRTVAGVARSLGAPIVTARPSATEGSVVTIVVAWELSWYRFEVDLADEAAGVRVVAQGAELDELEPADHSPNAAADEHGRLHPAASVA